MAIDRLAGCSRRAWQHTDPQRRIKVNFSRFSAAAFSSALSRRTSLSARGRPPLGWDLAYMRQC
jgi:hypothetical protein